MRWAHHSGTRILVGLTAAIVAGYFGYRAVQGRPVDKSLKPAPSVWGPPKEHMKVLAKVPTIDPTDGAVMRAELERALEIADDASAAFDGAPRDALLDTLSRYIAALTATSPESYLAIADSEPTAWIGPDDDVWLPIDDACMFFLRSPADRSDPRGTLAQMLVPARFSIDPRHKHVRYARIGTTSRGMRILVAKGMTLDQLSMPLLAERFGRDEYEYWTRGGRHSIRFRNPIVSPNDILRRHKSLLYAQAVVLLMTANDKPGVWHSTWYWDPDAKAWLNSDYAVESYHSAALGMYY